MSDREKGEITRTISIALAGGRMILIEIPNEFSEQDHAIFSRVLVAMKDGLIHEVPPPAPAPSTGVNP